MNQNPKRVLKHGFGNAHFPIYREAFNESKPEEGTETLLRISTFPVLLRINESKPEEGTETRQNGGRNGPRTRINESKPEEGTETTCRSGEGRP